MMVKFFLKNQKNQPKSQYSYMNKNKSYKKDRDDKQEKQKKGKKKIGDYRIVIWKKMFNLIKTEHSAMVQKIIRKIKQTKEKIEERADNNTHKKSKKDTKEEPAESPLNKQLTKLDAKYQNLKQIKKHQLKLITIYIIVEVLKIQNIEKVIVKAKFQDKSKIQLSKLKQQLESNEGIKKFIQKLSMLTEYQAELQKCAQLVDVVQQKKLESKQRIKDRKKRKYEREHQVEPQKKQGDQAIQLQGIVQKQREDSHSQNNKSQNKKEKKEAKQFSKQKNSYISDKKPFNNYNNKNRDQSKQGDRGSNKYEQKRWDNNQNKNRNGKFDKFSKDKPIHKQRTQFKKTGRNKVKYEKEQEKQRHRNNDRNKDMPQRRYARENFPKQQAHPSWQAKQDLKKQVFIKPFQGKKMLL